MEHTEKTQILLKQLSIIQKELPNIGNKILSADQGSLFPFDLVVIGIIKRSLSLTSAFLLLVNEFNMIASRALLRMHIDTVLRLSAFWLVKDPHELAHQVIKGKQINHMKDKKGQIMTDSYLANNLSRNYNWIKKVYRYTSGYIHFSERHLFDPISELDDKTRTIRYLINDKDYKFPEFSWLELIECFINCSKIMTTYLEGYRLVKNNVVQRDKS
jgi:hypothetical protein